jgi:hypothetical protein
MRPATIPRVNMHGIKSASMSRFMRRFAKLPVLAAVMGTALTVSLTSAQAGTITRSASASTLPVAQLGQPWPLPKPAKPSGNLTELRGSSVAGGSADTQQAAMASAARRAKATGKAVLAAALTSATTTVTAEPDGKLSLISNVLPVRVRRGSGWTPLDTTLRLGGGGSWSATAVPGDAVTFSGGGRGPLASLAVAGTSLSVSWPSSLPVPVINGSSATYRNVLPGTDLVVTATSEQAGGFSEVLVVHTAAAAENPALARLMLQVSSRGVRLTSAPGGGLVARAGNGQGSYVAPAPLMWDSGSAVPGSAAMTAASRSARSVGASIAPPGSGSSSSAAGPATGARVATVTAAVTGGGSRLSLVPDAEMLASPATRFPVFIDPSFTWYATDGDEQHFDILQSGCPTAGHYDTPDTTDYGTLPVGYDGWAGCNPGTGYVYSYDFSYYQIAVPSGLLGANIDTATFNDELFYASACQSAYVTLSLTGSFGKNTDWTDAPGPSEYEDTNDTPDPAASGGSNDCGTTNNNLGEWLGWNALGAVKEAVSRRWSSMSFRLWEDGDCPSACDGGDGDGNKYDMRRFYRDPYIQVLYNDTPDVPGALKATATSDGTGSVGCDTDSSDSNMPMMGKSASVHGPYLWATYNDPDTDTVSSTVQYWNTASPATTYTASAGSSLSTGSTPVAAEMLASFTSGMAPGTEIGWRANASDGHFTSVWSATCYFKVDPTDPDPPALSTVSGSPAVGSQVSVTITANNDNADPASKFIWGLDTPPPTTGTIPAAQECTTTAATSSCTQISGGVATLTITVPSPGPHDLWVYEQDSAGNDSGITNGAPAADTVTFIAADDPQTIYDSNTSLSASFTDALDAGSSYDNTMISDGSSACGAGADGGSKAFPSAELESAGWNNQNGTVTIDGAQFTLPDFGACQPDNLLAARQTLDTTPGGVQASALVFLATSTYASAQVPGTVSGASDSGVLAGDTTAPAVPGGTAVTGDGCTGATAFETEVGCTPASGEISYAGCSSTYPTGETYSLTVPDWVTGPSDIAAVSVPDWESASGLQAKSPKIYAFSVPLDAACPVTSVSLPDVGAAVSYTVASGVTSFLPALHIFGLAFRNTTTATPGSSIAQPSGQAWTAAYASPAADAFPPTSGTWGNQTIRLSVSPTISAAAGADLRIRLSDPGFLSADGDGPLDIGAASVAPQYYQSLPTQQPSALAFGGSPSVTIPEGGDVYSDPFTLTFPVTAGDSLLISLWVENPSLPLLPANPDASGGYEFAAAPGSGDNTEWYLTSAPFTGTGSALYGATSILTGVDITTTEETASPGEPTVVVAGNGVIDFDTSSAWSDATDAPSQRVAGQLASQGVASGFGVADAGLASNQVLSDTSSGGLSLLARLDRDVLAEPDVGTVVIDEGLEDLLQAGAAGSTLAAGSLEQGYSALISELGGAGINVIVATLTPCSGYANATEGDSCTAGTSDAAEACQLPSTSTTTSVDNERDTVDYDVCHGQVPGLPAPGLPTPPGLAAACPADFDAAVSTFDPTTGTGVSPEALASADSAGDQVNLSPAGYAALAPQVTTVCPLAVNVFPMPPPS